MRHYPEVQRHDGLAQTAIRSFIDIGELPKRWRKDRLKWEELSKPLSKAASVTVLPIFVSKWWALFNLLSISHLPGVVL